MRRASFGMAAALLVAAALLFSCDRGSPDAPAGDGTTPAQTRGEPAQDGTSVKPRPTQSSPGAAARITATPNPVPAKARGLGTTTIRWDMGSGKDAEVYVAAGGGPEDLFARGPKGSKEAAWIGPGRSYAFRLYEGTGRKTRLAEVTVTGQK